MINLIAHRGNNNHFYQENTIDAVLNCLKKEYIQGVEIDVQITKDKKVVISHDYTINRITKKFGIIRNLTLKQLKKYNFGNSYKKSKIITLNKMLKKIKSFKLIIIDIKSYFLDYKYVANLVIKTVKKYKNLNIILASASNKLTDYLLTKKLNLSIGQFVLSPYTVNKNYNIYFINYKLFNKVKSNKLLFYWTVNKKSFFDKHKISPNMYFITDKAYLL